jgi:hypothetical protein
MDRKKKTLQDDWAMYWEAIVVGPQMKTGGKYEIGS